MTTTTTTVRDLSTHEKVIEFLEETIGLSDYGVDYAGKYGEPGYSDPTGATPMIVLGNYWCRCAEGTDEPYGDGSYLHDRLGMHYPAELEILEEQGVVFEWADEWVVVHDEDAAYRVQADSYSWKPSAILGDDCEWMTPASDPEVWIEWAKNDPTRCIPDHVIDVDLTELGWERWPDDTTSFENGWYGGQDADPRKIEEEIIRSTEGYVEVVFVLDRTGQFDLAFSAYYRVVSQDDSLDTDN